MKYLYPKHLSEFPVNISVNTVGHLQLEIIVFSSHLRKKEENTLATFF